MSALRESFGIWYFLSSSLVCLKNYIFENANVLVYMLIIQLPYLEIYTLNI